GHAAGTRACRASGCRTGTVADPRSTLAACGQLARARATQAQEEHAKLGQVHARGRSHHLVMLRRLAFSIVVSLALGQGLARADADDADALINQGLKAMRKGDYQSALDAFRRAHQARPTTRSRTEIGLAEQALHRWAEAEADLAGVLAEEENPWLESHRSLLEKALADVRSHLGMLTVESGPRGAQVKIDGQP